MKELLFEPFFRVKPDRGRSVGGLGLGLAIARSAILAQGGTIELHNRTNGNGQNGGQICGLTVRVLLPI